MCLHLPFFLLCERNVQEPMDPIGLSRNWTNISFLNIKPSDKSPDKAWGIQETPFSLIVSGISNCQWQATAFADSQLDGFLYDCDDDELINVDQLSHRLSTGEERIKCPREYFLTVFEDRLRIAKSQWYVGFCLYLNSHRWSYASTVIVPC